MGNSWYAKFSWRHVFRKGGDPTRWWVDLHACFTVFCHTVKWITITSKNKHWNSIITQETSKIVYITNVEMWNKGNFNERKGDLNKHFSDTVLPLAFILKVTNCHLLTILHICRRGHFSHPECIQWSLFKNRIFSSNQNWDTLTHTWIKNRTKSRMASKQAATHIILWKW